MMSGDGIISGAENNQANANAQNNLRVNPPNNAHGTPPPVPPNGEIDSSSFASRVQIPKINGYSVNNIESWFTRLEAFFRIQNFGKMNQKRRDAEKFNMTIMHLDEKLYEQAFEIIRNPPEENLYDTLKQTIISKFSASSISRLEQLTSGIQLGDNKPSHMLTQLQRTDVTRDKQIIKDFWIQRLPVAARAVIAGVDKSSPNMTLEELAIIADEIVDTVRVNNIESIGNTVSPNANISAMATNQNNDRISMLEKIIARIENKLDNPNHNGRSRNRQRENRDKTPHRSKSRNNYVPANNGKCWYHSNYGDLARKCTAPCTFITNKKN